MEKGEGMFWCSVCRIPVYGAGCGLCKNKAQPFVRDCRIVFPEEKRLLEILTGRRRGAYDEKSVWNGGGNYYIDGERLPLQITKLTQEEITSAGTKVLYAFEDMDPRFFEEMVCRFVKANRQHFFELEKEAIWYIRRLSQEYAVGNMYVSFSGGKDSTVTAELVQRALGGEILHAFADTTLEFSWTYDYISGYRRKHPEVPFICAKNEEQEFFSLCSILGPPSRIMRWCCTVFKTSALNRRLDMCFPGEEDILSFQGLRRSESAARQKYQRTSSRNKIGRQVTASPVIHWKDIDIWLYILTTGIDFNKAYRLGYARAGCWCCPNNSAWSEILTAVYMPEYHKKYQDYLLEFARKTGKKDPEEYVKKGLWKARQGGNGLAHAGRSVIEFHPCVEEKRAFYYEMSRPFGEEFCELWKPFGVINKEIGDKRLGEFYVMDQDMVPILRIQGKNGSKRVKIVMEHPERMGTKSRERARHYIDCQITKYQMCIKCHACEEICPAGAIRCPENGIYRIDEKKCRRCRKCITYYSGGCYVRKILTVHRSVKG